MDIVVAPDPQSAAREAAALLCSQLRRAASRRGEAFVAVSGGSTPAIMLAALATMPVPWDATSVYQVDERVAPADDPDRNALLLDVLRPRRPVIELMPVEAPDLEAASVRYARSLPERFDVVHLGVGDDGHTASWPPGDPVIDADTAVAISGEYRGRVRMTLTPHVVNAARHRLVLVTGESKAGVVARWVLGDDRLPINRVHRSNTVVVLDAAAAKQLDPGAVAPSRSGG